MSEKTIEDVQRKADASIAHIADCWLRQVSEMEAEKQLLIEAFDAIEWMAKEYAEGGGSGGPEMRDFKWAVETVEKLRLVATP